MCKTIYEYLQQETLKTLEQYFEAVGSKREEEIEFISLEEEIDPNTSYYYYDGPLDDKTRGFCAFLLKQDKLYTQDDLDSLSNLLGYDVYLYVAGFNCRHQWKRARLKGALKEGYIPDQPSKGDINKAAVKQPNSVAEYFRKIKK